MPYHYSGNTQHQITSQLSELLADIAIVYYKTHAFHWNVEGANFYSLHLMLEKFYTYLWESMDEIAEHIRALGGKVPSSYAELLQYASIKENEGTPAAHVIVQILRDDYLDLSKKAEEVGSFADSQGDRVTTDLLTEKSKFLSKAAWMLQSSASA